MINPMSDLAQLPMESGMAGSLRSELEFRVLQETFAQINRGRALLRVEIEQLRRLTALELQPASC
jgi:hypothetical protein